MKRFGLLMLCVCVISGLGARVKKPVAPNRNIFISQMLRQQSSGYSALRTTSGVTRERVVAQSTRDTVSGPLSDSVYLGYSAALGAAYDYNTMIYPYNYPYSTTPMFNLKGVFTRPQVMADTYKHWTLNPFTLAYGLYEFTFANFDSDKNLVSFRHNYTDSVTTRNTAYVNSFSSSGNILSGTWFGSVGGVMDSAFRQYFSYDVSGNLLKDSLYEMHLGTWHQVARTFYSYDAANNLIQIDGYAQTDTTYDSVLAEQLKYVNTYDASHRLTSVATWEFDNTSLAASGRDTFAYSGSTAFHTSWRSYQYDNINHYWAPQFRMTKTLSAGLPDTILTNGFDSAMNAWVPLMMQIARYDTAGNPDTLYEYDYNFTSFPVQPDYTTVYYYKLYQDVTKAQDVMPAPLPGVYPNPATNEVAITGIVFTGKIVVSIVDESGRLVLRQYCAVTNGQVRIELGTLVTGSYIVALTAPEGAQLGCVKFIKR